MSRTAYLADSSLGVQRGFASDAAYVAYINSTQINGTMYFNSTSGTYRYWFSAAWHDLTPSAGNVTGPGSSVASSLPVFADTSGALLADSLLLVTGTALGPASDSIVDASPGSTLSLSAGSKLAGTGDGGAVVLQGGISVGGNGGGISIASGSATGGNGDGGNVTIQASGGSGTGTPGEIDFQIAGNTVASVSSDGLGFNLANQSTLRLLENISNGSNYVGIQSPALVGTSYTIVLPAAAPAANTFLHYDGTNYNWVSGGGGGGGDINNGGNSFGADITIGTTDDFQLTFITNNVPRLTLLDSASVLYVPPSDTNPVDLQVSAGSMITDGPGGNLTLVSGAGVGSGVGGDITLYSGTGTTPGNIIFSVGGGERGRWESNGTFAIDNNVDDVNADAAFGIAGQFYIYFPLATTTNATPAIAFNYVTRTNYQESFEVRMKGYNTSSGNGGQFFVRCRVKNHSGVVTVTTLSNDQNSDIGSWNISVVPSGLNVQILVTGSTGENVTWDGHLIVG